MSGRSAAGPEVSSVVSEALAPGVDKSPGSGTTARGSQLSAGLAGARDCPSEAPSSLAGNISESEFVSSVGSVDSVSTGRSVSNGSSILVSKISDGRRIGHGMTDEQLMELVPRSVDGDAMSLGSVGHEIGRCNAPCVYAQTPRARCPSGLRCNFCHFPHTPGRNPARLPRRLSDSSPNGASEPTLSI
ncbi:unnamed protein product [Prorocentrum cordatum]|uniref:C3H1-type domain-containing protein n=1 Tax=Prorocentrum cordatum TaxID=2364126 RepID=A0ABN9QXZ8_9DINO|nr:unnamed protein product [Polarella glacialis]